MYYVTYVLINDKSNMMTEIMIIKTIGNPVDPEFLAGWRSWEGMLLMA